MGLFTFRIVGNMYGFLTGPTVQAAGWWGQTNRLPNGLAELKAKIHMDPVYIVLPLDFTIKLLVRYDPHSLALPCTANSQAVFT